MILKGALILISPVLLAIIWMMWDWFISRAIICEQYRYRTTDDGILDFYYKSRRLIPFFYSLIEVIPMLVFAAILPFMGGLHKVWFLLCIFVFIVVFIYNLRVILAHSSTRKWENEGLMKYFSNDRIEKLCSALSKEDVTCINRKYIEKRVGFGKYERYVAVRLSNDMSFVLFNVTIREKSDEWWHLRMELTPVLTEEPDVINRFIPIREKIRSWLNPDENAYTALILYVLFWAVLVSVVVAPFVYNTLIWGYICWGYIIGSFILLYLEKCIDYPQWFKKVILFPSNVVDLAYRLSLPIILFVFGLGVIIFLAGICTGVLYSVSLLLTAGIVEIDLHYALFLFTASISVVSVQANGLLLYIVERIELFRMVWEETADTPIVGFVEYIFQKENINFLFYLAYLLFLIGSTAKHYLSPENEYLISKGVDYAVMAAFLVHIAMTNMMMKRKETKFHCEGLMDYVYKMLNGKE